MSTKVKVKESPKGAPQPARAGSSASAKATAGPVDLRPRAQVAYEGEDEFSVVSPAPRNGKPAVKLVAEELPFHQPIEQRAEAEGPEKQTAWHFVRDLFGQ